MRRHPFPRSRLVCFATLLVAAAFSGCGDPGRQEAVAEARTVRVAMVERVVEPSVLTVAAVVRPNQRALMGTRQAGTVEAVMVRTGDRVEKNQALLRVDARDLEAVRAAAERQKEASRVAWEQARRTRERFERLHDDDLLAKIRLEEAKVRENEARAIFEKATAELEAAEVNVEYTVLRAPFAGIVSEVVAEVGSFVGPGPPLVILENREKLRIEASLDEESAAHIHRGDRIEVNFVASAETAKATVRGIVPAMVETGVGLRLQLILDNPPAHVLPGMVAEVLVPTARAGHVFFRVPRSAVLRRGQLSGVFVVEGDQAEETVARLRWIALQAGDGAENRVTVTSGLRENERVVVGESIREIRDGEPVVIRKDKEGPADG